jgi:hypothetical protein
MTEASRQLIIPLPTILWRLNSKNPKFDSYKYDKNWMDKYAKADMRYEVDIEVQTTQELLLEILKTLQTSTKADSHLYR